MLNLDKIKYRIKRKEGCKLTVYILRGIPHIGYGHKITSSDGIFVGDTITQERADDLFEHDFVWMLSGVRQLVPGYDNSIEGIQIALMDMAFNNGIEGLKGYKNFLNCINMGQKERAADQIIDSKNYRDPGLHQRYVELEQMVRNA